MKGIGKHAIFHARVSGQSVRFHWHTTHDQYVGSSTHQPAGGALPGSLQRIINTVASHTCNIMRKVVVISANCLECQTDLSQIMCTDLHTSRQA